MKHLLPFAVAILAVILTGTACAETVGDGVAVPVDGKAFAARPVGIGAEWHVTSDAAGQRPPPG